VAFPHARIEGFPGFLMAMGVSPEGIPFDSIDKKPAHIVIVLVSSQLKPYIVLQAMGALIKFLNTGRHRELIMRASAQEIWDLLDATGIDITHRVQARDIMRPVMAMVKPEMTIDEAARIMHLNHLSGLPVAGSGNEYLGYVSSNEIFKFGVPDFFSKLKTVSFVRHIDPFEKYFASQHSVRISDIYCEGGGIDRNATLLEIVFEMSVKGYSKLYVLNNGRIEGLIDSYQLIDKVIFM